MASQLHFSEIALADGFEEPVVADVRVVRARGHGVAAAHAEGTARRAGALLRTARRQRCMLHGDKNDHYNQPVHNALAFYSIEHRLACRV